MGKTSSEPLSVEMHLMRGDNMASCAVAEGKYECFSAPGGVR
ncbi:hypothetical protein U370_01200 [Anaplasma marginale str. Dawn]|nr:hypothetical protein U128_01210 [Anaplasma marginale str. Gypsy Plains]AGZ80097.1 hypothetical protein U370_01200 [Anaplasma marginale str. Dawn]